MVGPHVTHMWVLPRVSSPSSFVKLSIGLVSARKLADHSALSVARHGTMRCSCGPRPSGRAHAAAAPCGSWSTSPSRCVAALWLCSSSLRCTACVASLVIRRRTSICRPVAPLAAAGSTDHRLIQYGHGRLFAFRAVRICEKRHRVPSFFNIGKSINTTTCLTLLHTIVVVEVTLRPAIFDAGHCTTRSITVVNSLEPLAIVAVPFAIVAVGRL